MRVRANGDEDTRVESHHGTTDTELRGTLPSRVALWRWSVFPACGHLPYQLAAILSWFVGDFLKGSQYG